MRRFDVDGRSYIRINGKTFFLLRGYCVRYDKWVMVQVFGTAPLTKDDLPEKNWEVISTKGPEGKVYTAWKPSYFDGSNETRLFIGATEHASLALAIGHRLDASELPRALADAYAVPEHYAPGLRHDIGLSTLRDEGSSGVPAITINHVYAFDRWIEQLKEKPCQ